MYLKKPLTLRSLVYVGLIATHNVDIAKSKVEVVDVGGIHC
jgi:hypothetical protein